MDFTQFIPSSLLILVSATYVLGVFLKKSPIPDKYIPIALMVFCITLAFLLNLINGEYRTAYVSAVNALLQGILCWGVAVGVNQTVKQLNKEEQEIILLLFSNSIYYSLNF